MSGTFCSVAAAECGRPAPEGEGVFSTVAEALADRQRLADEAAASAPPLIAAELAEHLDWWRALPADMSDADKDAAFYARFPEADGCGLLRFGAEDGKPDAIEGLA